MSSQSSSISNVLVFVADALRFDSLPEEVTDRGVTFKTVAQSTFSAPGFATLATGRYPQEHGVMSFVERIPDSIPTLFDISEFDSTFYQADGDPPLSNPIFDVLRRDSLRTIEELEPPFIYMERDMTTHFPHADEETAPSYLASRKTDWERIQSDYEEAVDLSMSRLEERLDVLADRGILDETLVIVTADHGEIIGEYSEIGHTTPVSPELAYVPSVFIHDTLSADDFAVDPSTDVIEHTDLIETVARCIGADDSFTTAGVDLRRRSRPREFGYCTVSARPSRHADRHWLSERLHRGLRAYDAHGAFWYDGGYVMQTNARTRRLFHTLYRLADSPHRYNVRDDPLKLLSFYLQNELIFGEIPIEPHVAKQQIESLIEEITTRDAETFTVGTESQEQLRDLGYLD